MIKLGYFIFISLFCTGLFCLFYWKNNVRRVISLGVFSTSAIVFLITISYTPNSPMIVNGIAHYSDPLPSALMLTSIVVGASIQGLLLAMLMSQKKALSSHDIS